MEPVASRELELPEFARLPAEDDADATAFAFTSLKPIALHTTPAPATLDTTHPPTSLHSSRIPHLTSPLHSSRLSAWPPTYDTRSIFTRHPVPAQLYCDPLIFIADFTHAHSPSNDGARSPRKLSSNPTSPSLAPTPPTTSNMSATPNPPVTPSPDPSASGTSSPPAIPDPIPHPNSLANMQPAPPAQPTPTRTPIEDIPYYGLRSWLSQPTIASFIAGGTAGAVSRTVVSPLERLKILLQVQNVGRNEYKMSIGKALSKMWREEGWRGMMAGNGTNCIRIVPYSAVQFSSYNIYKKVCIIFFLYSAFEISGIRAAAGTGSSNGKQQQNNRTAKRSTTESHRQ